MSNNCFQENCQGGCPCENFLCLEVTTTASASDTTTTSSNTLTTTSTEIITTISESTTTTAPITTTPAPINAVLVLNRGNSLVVTFEGKIILNFSSTIIRMILGAVNYDPDFQYESGTESKGGCSITLKGQMWYLGGSQNKRQVKKIKH